MNSGQEHQKALDVVQPDLSSRTLTNQADNNDAVHEEGIPGKCNSPTRQGEKGALCKNRAGFKTDHVGIGRCKYHGGATYTHRESAKRIRAEQMMVTYGIPKETTPHEAILDAIHRSAGHVEFLREQVQALSKDQLVWGTTEAKQLRDVEEISGDGQDGTVHTMYEAKLEAGANTWLLLYDRERDRLHKMCVDAIKIGIEEKRVEIAQRQGSQLSYVLKAVLLRMGITQEKLLELPHILGEVINGVVVEK